MKTQQSITKITSTVVITLMLRIKGFRFNQPSIHYQRNELGDKPINTKIKQQ